MAKKQDKQLAQTKEYKKLVKDLKEILAKGQRKIHEVLKNTSDEERIKQVI